MARITQEPELMISGETGTEEKVLKEDEMVKIAGTTKGIKETEAMIKDMLLTMKEKAKKVKETRMERIVPNATRAVEEITAREGMKENMNVPPRAERKVWMQEEIAMKV